MSNQTAPTPPNVRPEPGWETLDLPFNIGSGRTVYSSMAGDNRLRLAFFGRKRDGHLVGNAWFGEGTDGPPGMAHGGAIAYVLDEVMGGTGWLNLYPVVAVKLNFNYMKMTPLHVDTFVEGWITNVTDTRVFVGCSLKLPNGEIAVTGEGEFAILRKEKVEKLYSSRADLKDIERLRNIKWAKGNAG